MDVEKAIEQVQAFRADLAAYDRLARTTYAQPEVFAGPQQAVSSRIHLMIKIAEEVGLGNADRIREWNLLYKSGTALAATDELLGILQGRERDEAVLGPAGPKLAAYQLHRWVWQPAAGLWDNSYRREATQAAAMVFDSQLPAKLGVPRGAKAVDLIRQAFSTQPPAPGAPRLRLSARQAPNDPDWVNQHEGAMHFGRGCAMAIPNVQSHSSAQPDEQEALEALAALSLLARWIDSAQVDGTSSSATPLAPSPLQ